VLTAQEKSDLDTVYYIEPVTVTATQATERLTPVTFSNIRRSDIVQRYTTQDAPTLLSLLPSMTFYSENGNSSGGYSYINLRGFEQQRLSVMVNGVPQNDPEDFSVYWIDFPDLLGSTANIQVQRGAGSAFYGPPAIGGSVNILAIPYQPKPSIILESNLGFQEYGSTNTTVLSTRKYSASYNSGLIADRYMFYGRVSNLSTDGYRDKAWDEINSYFFGAQRLDSMMTTTIQMYGGPFTDGLVYSGIPKFYDNNLTLRRSNYNYFALNDAEDSVTYSTNRRPQESESFSQPHFEILNEWHLTPKITLNNTFFYIQGDGYYDYDGSGLDTTAIHWGIAYGIPVTANPSNVLVRAFVGNKQFGWLPRLEIDHGTGTVTVGAEIRIHRSIHWGKVEYSDYFPSNYNPDYYIYEYNGGKDIVSIYGHDLYKLEENLTVMTDLQVVYNQYSLKNEKYFDNSFTVPYFFANPRFGVNYNATDRVNTYFGIAYTSREPRLTDLYTAESSIWGSTPQFVVKDTVNGTVNYDYTRPIAKPEHLFDFEIGTGYRDQRSQVTFNFFWMEFWDELIQTGDVDIFGETINRNADRTRHLGLELDGQSNLGYGFSLSGNTTLSHNRLIKYTVVDTSGSIHRLDGNHIAGSPDYMANFRIAYTHGAFGASLDTKYVGSFYTDNTQSDTRENDAFVVCNASVSCRFALASDVMITVHGEVRNLFDRLYTMSGQGQEFFPAAERNYVLGMSLQL
jgi:iron complex outermembrane receptor protein